MKQIILFLGLGLAGCGYPKKISVEYYPVSVVDTMTIPSSHYHYLRVDSMPICIELPADTVISEARFWVKRKGVVK